MIDSSPICCILSGIFYTLNLTAYLLYIKLLKLSTLFLKVFLFFLNFCPLVMFLRNLQSFFVHFSQYFSCCNIQYSILTALKWEKHTQTFFHFSLSQTPYIYYNEENRKNVALLIAHFNRYENITLFQYSN